jgi:hypothetical protein
MSTTLFDGGPAFPVPVLADKDGNFISTHRWGEYMMDGGGGMSMRDWFAGQAVVGLFAATADPNSSELSCDKAARLAYETADAMLAERARKCSQ